MLCPPRVPPLAAKARQRDRQVAAGVSGKI